MVSQTWRWDKTELKREPGTHFTLIWTVCPYSQTGLCTACMYRYCIHTNQRRLMPLKRKVSVLLNTFHCKHQIMTNRKESVDMCHLKIWLHLCTLQKWRVESCEFFSLLLTKEEACDVHSDHSFTFCLFFFSLLHASCGVWTLKARQRRGQSHRKLRRQTTSHPAWALEETLPPFKKSSSSKCKSQRSLGVKAEVLCCSVIENVHRFKASKNVFVMKKAECDLYDLWRGITFTKNSSQQKEITKQCD